MRNWWVLVLVAACGPAEPADEAPSASGPDAVTQLVEAERAFARDAGERTVGEAFVTALAEDGILFRPDPVPGRAFMVANPTPPDLHLAWEPEYAEVSAAGDLGFTTGPWESGRRGQPPAGFGRFLSVWRRVDGAWHVALDHGIAHAGPRPTVTVTTRTGSGRAAGEAADADGSLNEALGTNGAAAYAAVLAADARILRDGAPPAVGAAATSLADGAPPARYQRAGGGEASSHDLAWSYGSWTADGAHGNYVRIWRAEDGAWRLAVDLVTSS